MPGAKRGSRKGKAGKSNAGSVDQAIGAAFEAAAGEPVPEAAVETARRLDRLIEGKRKAKARRSAAPDRRRA